MLKKYNEYRDSGIEWVGEIPHHWGRKPLKLICNIQGRVGYKGYTVGDLVSEGEGPYTLGAKHISKSNKLDLSKPEFISWKKYYESPEIMVQTGDLLLTQRGTLGKVAMIENEIGEATINPSMVLLTSISTVTKYLYYFFNTDYFVKWIDLTNTATAVPMISQEQLGKFNIVLPPHTEQTNIAKYLDQKTSQIDKLITDKEKLIELLKEERTAIINQAVTKGLNPDVPMKDSGIEWLGEVPEHWDVKKLKYLLKPKRDALKTGPFGSHLKNSDLMEDGDIKVYTQRNVLDNNFDEGEDFISIDKYESLKSFTVEPGDILLTTRGSIGRCSIFPAGQTWGILHPCLIRVQVDNTKASTEWVSNYINNTSLFFNNIKFNSNSTIIDVIYGYTLKEIFFPIPSIKEQSEILKFINDELQRIDNLGLKIRQEIELLKEYKTALISEVVTGKIDVRDEIIAESPELVS